jgi:hypothetical protein
MDRQLTNRSRARRSPIDRRRFLWQAAQGAIATSAALTARRTWAAAEPAFEVGSATVETTPPMDIELAGFHRAPGNERRITEIRQPTFARALALRLAGQTAAIVSLDIVGVSNEFSRDVARRAAARSGIPAENIRICATHTHSMPAFFFLRQWGAEPKTYEATVADKIVDAVVAARDDLASAECYVGRSAAEGGNFNRTTKTWKIDSQFRRDSTTADRWLDTQVHVLRFERSGRPNVLWYHFSAHPVCYTDTKAGPDWVGLTAELVRQKHGVAPAFLQGHAGDVNPGNGDPWLGNPERTAQAVADAIGRALESAARHPVGKMQMTGAEFRAPLDIDLLESQLQHYREHPEACTAGEWVDAGFAKDWYEDAQRWDRNRKTYAAPLSALRLGDVALVFHPGELYSYYGLEIRRDSPFAQTLVVGYTDGLIGYLADPQAYVAGEYAATTVPRILGLPPFQCEAASVLSSDCHRLLSLLAAD